jgi:hypothetical protein
MELDIELLELLEEDKLTGGSCWPGSTCIGTVDCGGTHLPEN